jgi:hypothetical protein
MQPRGSFLLRCSTTHRMCFAVSFRTSGGVHHALIQQEGPRRFFLETQPADVSPSLQALVAAGASLVPHPSGPCCGSRGLCALVCTALSRPRVRKGKTWLLPPSPYYATPHALPGGVASRSAAHRGADAWRRGEHAADGARVGGRLPPALRAVLESAPSRSVRTGQALTHKRSNTRASGGRSDRIRHGVRGWLATGAPPFRVDAAAALTHRGRNHSGASACGWTPRAPCAGLRWVGGPLPRCCSQTSR